MIQFKKILFPVDLSAQSQGVAGSVQAMARHFGAEITVLHVAGSDGHHGDQLGEFADKAFPGERVIRKVVEGEPAEQIVAYARAQGTDLIMIPTHGYGPFRELFLGSVTAKVLEHATCPVWTGVHAEEMMAHSPEHWKRMLCAADTEDKDVRVIQWASAFAKEQNMEVRLVHAVAGSDGMWTEQNDPSMYEFLFDAARERLAELQSKAGTNLEVRLTGGTVGNAVRRIAVEEQVDLIVMGRGGGSIIREAPSPTISISDETAPAGLF
jgi:nucleotide-binding universal stress UspA family protein